MQDENNSLVALTETPNGVISTVFLGMNYYSFRAPEQDRWFETVVASRYFHKYSSWDLALAGHQEMVKEYGG
jgi:hypothetical protein